MQKQIINIHPVKLNFYFIGIIFIAILFLGFFGVVKNSQAAIKFFEYGFEDWTGDADTTPTYPFGTNISSYWIHHEQVTEVVENCTVGGVNWEPHSGNNFFYTNAYGGETDACLGTTGYVGTYDQYGYGAMTYGANGDFDYQDYINYETGDRELYTRFEIKLDPNFKTTSWVDGDGNPAIATNANLKIFRTYMRQDGTDGCILYLKRNHHFAFACTGEVAWSRSVDLLNTHSIDLMDGEWHQIAVWHKLQDTAGSGYGSVKIWVDGTLTQDYSDLALAVTDDDFEYSYFLNNFSALYPTSHLSMALDDIEVWDGIPDETSDTTPPSAPSGLSVN